MTFYNAKQRVMEGELRFPLGEGQEIARLALEINGKQRGRLVEVSYTLPITISVDGETMVNANPVRPTSRNNGTTRRHNNVPKHKETLQVEKREVQTPVLYMKSSGIKNDYFFNSGTKIAEKNEL